MKTIVTVPGICLALLLMSFPPISAEDEWINGKWESGSIVLTIKAGSDGRIEGQALAQGDRIRRGQVKGTIKGNMVVLDIDWSNRVPIRYDLQRTNEGMEGTATRIREGRKREIFFEKKE